MREKDRIKYEEENKKTQEIIYSVINTHDTNKFLFTVWTERRGKKNTETDLCEFYVEPTAKRITIIIFETGRKKLKIGYKDEEEEKEEGVEDENIIMNEMTWKENPQEETYQLCRFVCQYFQWAWTSWAMVLDYTQFKTQTVNWKC